MDLYREYASIWAGEKFFTSDKAAQPCLIQWHTTVSTKNIELTGRIFNTGGGANERPGLGASLTEV